MSTLNRAIEIAAEAHEGAIDKYGAPYINHVTRVMNIGGSDSEKIVGVLHDVIEDTHWTFEDLEKEGFSKEVINALRCVTKTSEDEDYEEFITRVKISPLAVKVKLNDLTDNLDVKRMPEVLESDLKRLNKYLRAYNELIMEKTHIFTMLYRSHLTIFSIDNQYEKGSKKNAMVWSTTAYFPG
jgi:(p)ppGpp synthase/HD superfamily hydrolase